MQGASDAAVVFHCISLPPAQRWGTADGSPGFSCCPVSVLLRALKVISPARWHTQHPVNGWPVLCVSALAEVPRQQALAAAPNETQRSPRTACLGPSSSECHAAQGCLWPQPLSFLPRNVPLGRGKSRSGRAGRTAVPGGKKTLRSVK